MKPKPTSPSVRKSHSASANVSNSQTSLPVLSNNALNGNHVAPDTINNGGENSIHFMNTNNTNNNDNSNIENSGNSNALGLKLKIVTLEKDLERRQERF